MIFKDQELHLLVIEDNSGDFLLIQEYIKIEIAKIAIHHARSFSEAQQKLKNTSHIDAIILDLTLPDKSGPDLVKEMIGLSGSIPIIVLTGHEDKAFGIKTLSWGVSDYLLKENLSGSQLYKAIVYSIERKSNLRNLKESEEKYKSIFSLNPLPMWLVDVESHFFLDVNEAAIRNYGYSREEFLAMTIGDMRPKADLQMFEEKIKKFKRGNSIFFQGVSRHKRKSGEIIIVEIQSNEISLNGKKARLVLGNDITKRYIAEERLKLSEKRFKALVQEGSDMIAILDMHGVYLYASPTSASVLGMNSESFVGKSVFDYIHGDDYERVKNYFKLLQTQKRIHLSPFRFINEEGEWRWIETVVTNLIDDPAVNGIVANSKDITNAIESELKLRESMARYNIVAKATSDIIWDWDMQTNKIIWNKGIKNVFGYEESAITEDRNWWIERIHPDDSARIISRLRDHIKNKFINWREEYRFRSADGAYKYVLDKGFLVIDKQDNPVRMLGAMQDITKRKEEEDHLRLLESVITNAKDAVMVTEANPLSEPGPRIIYVNRAFEKMTGYSIDEVIGRSPRFLQGPKSDRAELDYLKRKLGEGEGCKIEVVNYTKTGKEYWVQMEIAPVKNNDEIVTHFIAIERDVTEQKKYTQAIEQQNIKLREIGWMQSHIVRAPLARIMGLVEYLQNQEEKETTDPALLNNICFSANELDNLLREIVKKTEQVKINSNNEVNNTNN